MKVRARIGLWVVLAALWLLFAGSLDPQELVVGWTVALGIALLPLPGLAVFAQLPTAPKRLVYAGAFLFVFLGAVVRSNLDVAFRVLNPRLPINPGFVRVRTRLQSPLGRLILANSITLTPGTITVDTHGDQFEIHWININSPSIDDATEAIVAGFERYLEVIFG